MQLTLDHTQRLNLYALLGAQRGDVSTIRAIWSIQDKLALNAEEEHVIELKREVISGQERAVWNPAIEIPAKEFEFTEAEVARVRAAIENWASYGVADRRWLEPLVAALFETASRPYQRAVPPLSQ
jgi:hypothetical protein